VGFSGHKGEDVMKEGGETLGVALAPIPRYFPGTSRFVFCTGKTDTGLCFPALLPLTPLWEVRMTHAGTDGSGAHGGYARFRKSTYECSPMLYLSICMGPGGPFRGSAMVKAAFPGPTSIVGTLSSRGGLEFSFSLSKPSDFSLFQ
jgi:hypothetical protein